MRIKRKAYGGNRSIPFSSMESNRLIGSLSREICKSMLSSMFSENSTKSYNCLCCSV